MHQSRPSAYRPQLNAGSRCLTSLPQQGLELIQAALPHDTAMAPPLFSAASSNGVRHQGWPPLDRVAVHESAEGTSITLDDLESYLGFGASFNTLRQLFASHGPITHERHLEQCSLMKKIVKRFFTNIDACYKENYFVLVHAAIIELGTQNNFANQFLSQSFGQDDAQQARLTHCIESAISTLNSKPLQPTRPQSTYGIRGLFPVASGQSSADAMPLSAHRTHKE